MNYKKGILSVVLWFIYAIIAGTGLVGTTMVMLPEGGSRPIGLVIAGVWLAVTGLVVFLLHRCLQAKWTQSTENSGQVKLIIEGLIAVALIAVGIALRVREIMLYDISWEGGNIWFDAVKVTETTRIPQVVHGAVYFYLQVLHGLLVFLGNKMTAALVLQLVLQIMTGIFLFFAVRKLTGTVAAVVALGYWMLCPALSGTMILGPEPLYQLLWMIGLCVCVEALDSFRQRGDVPGIRSVGGFFLGGIAIGILVYLDVTGLLLLLVVFSVLFLETKQQVKWMRRIGAGVLGLFGTAVAFFACIALDAVGSGKQMENVLLAWWKVFSPGKFTWIALYEQPNLYTYVPYQVVAAIMVTILASGVFSYWCRIKCERQSVWLAQVLVLGILSGCGMLSEDMPGFTLLYLLLAIAAGAGIQAVLPYEMERLRDAGGMPSETVEAVPVGDKAKKRRLNIQDLEYEELPQEETAPAPEEVPEADKIQFIENPLPLPKKHVPKVLGYKLGDDVGDYDYPVADDDDFDH